MNPPLRQVLLVIACLALTLPGGCQKSSGGKEDSEASGTGAAEGAAAPAAGDTEGGQGVQLKPEQVEHLGIGLSSAQSAAVAPEVQGYGVVLSHDAIAQAVADLATARAAVRQSRAVLERAQHLAGTPGALSTDTLEGAERQAAVDSAALALAHRRLSATLGAQAPWNDDAHDEELNALAAGQLKLVRATFPLGSWNGAVPASVRIAHLDPEPLAASWKLTRLWSAPADASVPGRSFFALLEGVQFSEGEHVQVWAPAGPAVSGVLVPAAAVVINAGSYWCYVQKQAGSFVRIPVDTSLPAPGGYVVTSGIAPGDKIVTSAAGLLLAREINPSTEAE
jgi:hypothetical protein